MEEFREKSKGVLGKEEKYTVMENKPSLRLCLRKATYDHEYITELQGEFRCALAELNIVDVSPQRQGAMATEYTWRRRSFNTEELALKDANFS